MSCNNVLFDALGAVVIRDPASTLSIGFDWTDWLAQRGLTALDSSEWTATAGTAVAGGTFVDGITGALNSGGALGFEYTLRNTVTAGPETDVRSVRVRIVRT